MATLKVNDIDLNYRLDGDSSSRGTIMLCNSLAANLSMWDNQIAALINAGFHVLRFDTRGHGDSGVSTGPYNIDLLVRDALGLLDGLDIGRVHFCGLSLGGIIGQNLARHHPDRLLSLSLCATAAYLGPRDLWDKRIEAVAGGGMVAVVDATLERWFTAAGRERLTDRIAQIHNGIVATTSAGFIACAEAIRDMDQRDLISSITTPTLVLVGQDDPATPVSASEFIHDRIHASKLVVIPDAAHLVNVEQSELFNQALLEFLISSTVAGPV